MAAAYLTSHCRLVTNDLDEARESVGRVWERHRSELASGSLCPLRWHHADLLNVNLSYAQCDAVLKVECVSVGDCYRVSMPQRGRIDFLINGRSFEATPDRAALYGPGQQLRLSLRQASTLILTVRGDFLRRVMQMRESVPLPGAWPAGFAMQHPSAVSLSSLCRWVAEELERPHGLLTSRRPVVRHIERTLLSLLLDCVEGTDGRDAAEDLGERHLKRVENWLDAHCLEPVGVEEMAQVAGVGVRSVQSAFRRLRGCTPTQALIERRLLRARQALSTADPQATVREVAAACGFAHLGRFAGRYAQAFGEPPSATLERARR